MRRVNRAATGLLLSPIACWGDRLRTSRQHWKPRRRNHQGRSSPSSRFPERRRRHPEPRQSASGASVAADCGRWPASRRYDRAFGDDPQSWQRPGRNPGEGARLHWPPCSARSCASATSGAPGSARLAPARAVSQAGRQSPGQRGSGRIDGSHLFGSRGVGAPAGCGASRCSTADDDADAGFVS